MRREEVICGERVFGMRERRAWVWEEWWGDGMLGLWGILGVLGLVLVGLPFISELLLLGVMLLDIEGLCAITGRADCWGTGFRRGCDFALIGRCGIGRAPGSSSTALMQHKKEALTLD